MRASIRTLVITGGTSGICHEALKSLTTSGWHILVGARGDGTGSIAAVREALGSKLESVECSPLELGDLRSVETFAEEVKRKFAKVDRLVLGAAQVRMSFSPLTSTGECEELMTNHYSQHYLIQLLREQLEAGSTPASRSRVVVVSSEKHRSFSSLEDLSRVLSDPDASAMKRYDTTKTVQLLGAIWWSRQLRAKGVDVVALTPGFVPTTGLGREAHWLVRVVMQYLLTWAPFASTLQQGANAVVNGIEADLATYAAGGSDAAADELLYLNNKLQALPIDKRLSEVKVDDPIWSNWLLDYPEGVKRLC